MEFTDFMLWKAIALLAAIAVVGFIKGFIGR
jgi:hypothetical protein